MKTFYENPEMDIVKFSAEDVISTSLDSEGGSQGGQGGMGGDNEGLPGGGFPGLI